MKKQFLYSLAFLALVGTGCQQDEIESAPKAESARALSAVVDNSGDGPQNSRVAFDNRGAFYWTSDDQIGVLGDKVYPSLKKPVPEDMPSRMSFPWKIVEGSYSNTDKVADFLPNTGGYPTLDKNEEPTFENRDYAIYPYTPNAHYVPSTGLFYNFIRYGYFSTKELKEKIMIDNYYSTVQQPLKMHMAGKYDPATNTVKFQYTTGGALLKINKEFFPLTNSKGKCIWYKVKMRAYDYGFCGGMYRVDMSRKQLRAEAINRYNNSYVVTDIYIKRPSTDQDQRDLVIPLTCFPQYHRSVKVSVYSSTISKDSNPPTSDADWEEETNPESPINFRNLHIEAGKIQRLYTDKVVKVRTTIKTASGNKRYESASLNPEIPSDEASYVTVKFWSPFPYSRIGYQILKGVGHVQMTYCELPASNDPEDNFYDGSCLTHWAPISQMVIKDRTYRMDAHYLYYNEISFRFDPSKLKEDLSSYKILFFLYNHNGTKWDAQNLGLSQEKGSDWENAYTIQIKPINK